MQMLTKFESKSNRVKNIAFHPRLTLLLSSLHNGSIQLWNFQMGTLVERFDEHDGPVRGIAFHPTQPLFVSGGDDYKIKVWNYKQRRCLFTLHGHLDYVRTVYFHHEHPWILSCSDDQTIRIWNWQSRQCIAILTGHNHYIMCAQFHPKEDLIVSCGCDQTVRVWDFSGLRKKTTQAAPTYSIEEQFQRQSNQLNQPADLFGNTDVVVKYVLEGHDRGVNWVSFHPTLPLLVSCSDDRQVKLWRMSETKAWEVDTCRGHFNNISMVLFHPKHELIISDSEDKTIRVWDMSKRVSVQTFRRESDRFWVLTCHPKLNLFAAGHDSGLIVFKLERERPAYALHQNTLFYVRDKYVRAHDLTTGTDAGVVSVKKLGNQYIQPRSLSYNPAEKSVLVTSTAEGGIYELLNLPKDITSQADSSEGGKRGQGAAALFVSRNRIAVFDKNSQNIEIRDLNLSLTKTIKCPVAGVTDIFFGGSSAAGGGGMIIMATATGVVLFDVGQSKIAAEMQTPPVKYAVWNAEGSMLALLSKHTVIITNRGFTTSKWIHETIRIKSGAWDDSGVFIYSTLNHIKYALPEGDSGIIKTLEQPVYLTRVKGKLIHCLDRNAKPKTIPIDPTEYRFKLALVRRNYDEVLHIIRTSNLVGQSIIGYLQQKGYPEIALHFVQDKSTRFDLAIECGNLEVALEMAKAIDKEEAWNRLGQQALKQGNHKIVEVAYQRTKNFERLSFLYLITGNTEKLAKMAKIAEMRGDNMSRFQNALYLGNAASRVKVLLDVGMYALAYVTARTNNLQELAEEVLTVAGLSVEEVDEFLPNLSPSKLKPPTAVSPAYERNWPTIGVTESFFDKALTSAISEPTTYSSNYANGTGAQPDLDEWAEDDLAAADGGVAAEEAEEAWDLGADVGEPDTFVDAVGETAEEGLDVSGGVSEVELWVRNSPLAGDHVAAGSFETAMQLLSRQVGAVKFEPLKSLFLSTYRSTKMYLPASASLPPIPIHLRRNPENEDPRSILPIQVHTLQSITHGDLKLAYSEFINAHFDESRELFRKILWTLLLVVTSTPQEHEELQKLVILCREYIIALSTEIERRRLAAAKENQKRQLELAAYFTHCQLQPPHLTLALRLAMSEFSKAKNYPTAARFAQRLLDLKPNQKVADTCNQVLRHASKSPKDAIDLDYDQFVSFDICPASLTPIYAGSPSVDEPLTGARYHPQYAGTVCKLTLITEVGRKVSGLRSSV